MAAFVRNKLMMMMMITTADRSAVWHVEWMACTSYFCIDRIPPHEIWCGAGRAFDTATHQWAYTTI